MLQQTETPTKIDRITRTYTVQPSIYKEFKNCADKDERIKSRIIENFQLRYIASRT